MARLVFGGVELYDANRPSTRQFIITEGGPEDADWDVRGEDDVISSAAGRTARNRVKDTLAVIAEGFINGVGTSIATQRTNFFATLSALDSVLQTDAAPATLTWEAPNGTTYQITVRYIRRSRGNWVGGFFRRYTLEWECIDPAGWTVVT